MLPVTEISLSVYRGQNSIQKRHRVAVIRAGDKVCQRLRGWTSARRQATSGELIFYNTLNVRSYTLGRVRADTAANNVSDDELRAIIDGKRDIASTTNHHLARYLDMMREGGVWWLHVEINKADNEGREADAVSLRAKLDNITAELRISRG